MYQIYVVLFYNTQQRQQFKNLENNDFQICMQNE